MVGLIRQHSCFAVISVTAGIFIGSSESGTRGCVVLVYDVLVCQECIRDVSKSGMVVIIQGREVMEEDFGGLGQLSWPGKMATHWLSYLWSGESLNWLRLCFSGRGGLWYVTGIRGLWLWFRCGVLGEDVLLDWVDVFPSLVVSLALGFDVVTSWGRGSVNDGASDVRTLVSWDRNSTS